MKKMNLGPTDKIHEHFSSKGKLYHKWHSGKAHHIVHWVIFISFFLTATFASLSINKDQVRASGGGVFLISPTVNKTTAIANGSEEIILSIFTYWNVCDTLLPGGGKTGTGDPGDPGDPGALCQEVTGSSAYHPEGETNRIAISVSGSGNSYDSSTVLSDSGGNVTFKIKSTVAETKTITVLNGWRALTNEWGNTGVKTVTFTAPSTSSPNSGASNSSSNSGTNRNSTKSTASSAPAQPGAPAIPVLESLSVGNTQFALDKIQGHQFKSSEKKMFSGKTIPNGIVHLYFQSEPFEDIATADKDGKWIYELTKDIGEGEHSLQIAVTDTATNLTSEKSALVKFTLVDEAKASSSQAVKQKKTPNYFWYILSGGILLVLILGVIESCLYFTKGKGFVLKRFLKPKTQI